MTLIALLVLLIVAGAVCWFAATYLPQPFSWIVCLVVILVLLVQLLGGVRLR